MGRHGGRVVPRGGLAEAMHVARGIAKKFGEERLGQREKLEELGAGAPLDIRGGVIW
jgi:hypothetical protein